jgi:hypothetical protein
VERIDTLERLRTERKAKIDELKDRTNYYLRSKLQYYLTLELIQVSSCDGTAKLKL